MKRSAVKSSKAAKAVPAAETFVLQMRPLSHTNSRGPKVIPNKFSVTKQGLTFSDKTRKALNIMVGGFARFHTDPVLCKQGIIFISFHRERRNESFMKVKKYTSAYGVIEIPNEAKDLGMTLNKNARNSPTYIGERMQHGGNSFIKLTPFKESK